MKTWYVVVDRSGFYRAMALGRILNKGDRVLGPPFTYIDACKEADKFNEVSQILTS
jgi:hypothetical protein